MTDPLQPLTFSRSGEAAKGPLAFDSRLAPLTTRATYEEPCPWCSPFQKDCDRIIHAKAFRRLAHKTQVFIASSGDHYRTRLTHTLEVAQIARLLTRYLGLNEYLAEAISLAHDLGHTPFGHAGEMALNELSPQGFHHQSQSLRVVEKLARHRSGLNLTLGVLDGIGKHSKGRGPVFIEGNGSPLTAEGQLVRAADIIAYLAHDLDDALEAGLLVQEDIPKDLLNIFGPTPSKRVEVMISDLLNNSSSSPVSFKPAFSKAMTSAMNELRDFLFVRVYRHPDLNVQLESGKAVIKLIYNSLMTDDALYDDSIPKIYQAGDRNEVVCDFISGMTDRFALQYAESLSCGLKPAVLTRLA